MVNAQTWLDQNYPINGTCINQEDKENYGKKREEIVNLDISNKNLEGGINVPGFTNLRKLNISFNKLIGFIGTDITNNIEEMDWSHNWFTGNLWTDKPIWPPTWPYGLSKLRVFNSSHNNFFNSSLYLPSLTHLDVGNNALAELSVRDGGNLVELRCSSNPIVNLFLAASPHLKSFDCFGINLMVPISPSTTSHISSTETVYINNPALLGSTISLGVYSGISTLGWIALGFVFFYKRILWKAVIPTPGS